MDLPELSAHFTQFVNMRDDEMKSFVSLLNKKEYPKKHTLLEIGEVESVLRFVTHGIVRNYVLKGDLDFTSELSFANEFHSAYSSFTSQMPSEVGSETLTKVVCYEMSYTNLQMLYNSSKNGERMGRLSAESICRGIYNRMSNLTTKTALERYELLLDTQPQIMQNVPQKFVAEYLGIAPESLSRLKKEIS